jgi:hypothetical protein
VVTHLFLLISVCLKVSFSDFPDLSINNFLDFNEKVTMTISLKFTVFS